MKVCVFGAGALGGAVAARLCAAGVHVSMVARGSTLAALRADGLKLLTHEQEIHVHPTASDNPADLGVQDLLVIAVKAHALPAAAAQLRPLMGPDTVVVPLVNGVPWWFLGGGFGASPIDDAEALLDPGRRIAGAIPSEAVLGAVLHGSFSVEAPGVVRNHSGREIVLGEPGGATTPRLTRVVDMLQQAGFDARTSQGIRQEVWFKLLGNLSTGPLCVLTGTSTAGLLHDPLTRELMRHMVVEAIHVGERLAIDIPDALAGWSARLQKLGDITPSMLQDLRAGRPMEIDAIVASVCKLGQALGVATPFTRSVLGLLRVKATARAGPPHP